MSEQKNTGIQKQSSAKGSSRKQGQAYQNFFQYKHNSKSKKTDKIAVTPLDRLCQRCYDTLQWKIDYRKYKPLTKAHKCNKCHQPKIIKAYRTVCDGCAHKDKNDGCKICTKCSMQVHGNYATPRVLSKVDEAKNEERQNDISEALESLKLKSRRNVERKIKNGEIKYDHQKKTFVYVEDEDKEFEVKNRDDDQYGDEEESDDYEEVKGEITNLENVDEALDEMDNENIESKIAEVTQSKHQEETKQIEEKIASKVGTCHRHHELKAKRTLPDCYIGKFDIGENFLYCDECRGPIDFNNIWFHHCKICQSDYCQKCKGQIIKTEEDADHQLSDDDFSDNEQKAIDKLEAQRKEKETQNKDGEQIEEQKN